MEVAANIFYWGGAVAVFAMVFRRRRRTGNPMDTVLLATGVMLLVVSLAVWVSLRFFG